MKKILLLLLLSSNVSADILDNYYRSMIYKHINGFEYISIKTNEDDHPLVYSTKVISISGKRIESIIISKKEFNRLLQEFKL